MPVAAIARVCVALAAIADGGLHAHVPVSLSGRFGGALLGATLHTRASAPSTLTTRWALRRLLAAVDGLDGTVESDPDDNDDDAGAEWRWTRVRALATGADDPESRLTRRHPGALVRALAARGASVRSAEALVWVSRTGVVDGGADPGSGGDPHPCPAIAPMRCGLANVPRLARACVDRHCAAQRRAAGEDEQGEGRDDGFGAPVADTDGVQPRWHGETPHLRTLALASEGDLCGPFCLSVESTPQTVAPADRPIVVGHGPGGRSRPVSADGARLPGLRSPPQLVNGGLFACPHVIFLIHGLGGNSHDLRLFRDRLASDAATAAAVSDGAAPELILVLAESLEGGTLRPLDEQAEALAREVRARVTEATGCSFGDDEGGGGRGGRGGRGDDDDDYVSGDSCDDVVSTDDVLLTGAGTGASPKLGPWACPPLRLSFVGHSLGAMVAWRAAGHPLLSSLRPCLQTFVALGGPFRGIGGQGWWGDAVAACMGAASRWVPVFSDLRAARQVGTLAWGREGGAGGRSTSSLPFRHVLLVAAPEDRFVPRWSALAGPVDVDASASVVVRCDVHFGRVHLRARPRGASLWTAIAARAPSPLGRRAHFGLRDGDCHVGLLLELLPEGALGIVPATPLESGEARSNFEGWVRSAAASFVSAGRESFVKTRAV